MKVYLDMVEEKFVWRILTNLIQFHSTSIPNKCPNTFIGLGFTSQMKAIVASNKKC